MESDWRLFPTLVRFDAVYSRLFKCTRRLTEMPKLWNYARELYRRPGIASTVRHDEILRHYYRSFPALNPHGIVPLIDPPDFGQSKNGANRKEPAQSPAPARIAPKLNFS